MTPEPARRLVRVAPELARILAGLPSAPPPARDAAEIRPETCWVTMRDGTRLATDVHLPPGGGPAPALAVRTPYGRASQGDALRALVRRGYVVVAQDCRGTGDSEPDHWDFMVHEPEDSRDFVDWMTGQPWYDGFTGSFGGSYGGWMQWCMAMNPAMSAIAPEVAGFGVGTPDRGPRHHMFVNAYAKSVGHGAEKLAIGHQETERQMTRETHEGGYFNEPMYRPFATELLDRHPGLKTMAPLAARTWLWDRYRGLPPAERAELVKAALGADRVTYEDLEAWSSVFPREIGDGYLFPRSRDAELFRRLRAPALVLTGWYDWCLGYTLATWDRLTRDAPEPVRSRSRLLIAPSAHSRPGYHEGRDEHPELDHVYRTAGIVDLLDHWYTSVWPDDLSAWPVVTYYLMGANEWLTAPSWPPPDTRSHLLYLGSGGTLTTEPMDRPSDPDMYHYDPDDPTPTVGGSIISSVYTPGSVDVSQVQARPDVLTYTTPPLEHDLDVVGPLRLVLYAGSSAVDTDFSARLSDVFPDGRAIQVQSGTVRARYRKPNGEPEMLEPGQVYRFDIDMWATANRFRAGHRLRVDISSADFPRYDRNTGRGGVPGPPVVAEQTVYRDRYRPSHLELSVVRSHDRDGRTVADRTIRTVSSSR
jgi:uncharacterized protein